MLVHDSIKTIVDGVWRRKWEIYYGIGTVSLLGNLIALFMRALDVNMIMSLNHVCAIPRCVVSKLGEVVVVFHSFIVPNVVVFHGFILSRGVVLCELMTRRGVLFLIFNLILVVLMIKSGLLNKTLSHIITSSASQSQEFPNWETFLMASSAHSIGHPNPSSTHPLLCSSTTHPSEDQHRPSLALPDLAHPFTFPIKETSKCPGNNPTRPSHADGRSRFTSGPIEGCHVAGHEVSLIDRGSYQQADVVNPRPLVSCPVNAIVSTSESSQHGPLISGCKVDNIVTTHEILQHGPSSHGCQVANVVPIYEITQQEPVIACQVDNTIVASPKHELSIACQVESKETPTHELIQDRPSIACQVADNNFAPPSLTLHTPITRCQVDNKDTSHELTQHRQIIPSQTPNVVDKTHGSTPRGQIGGPSYGEKRKSSKLSLFTIEPLEEVEDKDKVMDASMDNVTARRDGNEIAHLALQETCGDNELEFKERIDNFISKFKRSLTIQRQESLTRLLALVGACPPPRPKLSFVHKTSPE